MIRTFLELPLAEGAAAGLTSFFERESILTTAAAQDGCVGAELTIAADGRSAIVTALWADDASYEQWTSRTDRADLAVELSTFLDDPIGAATVGRINVVALATWS